MTLSCPCRALQGRRPLFNLLAFAVPMLTKLTERIRFPDMALLYNMWDEPPVRRSADEPGPWFGYCGKRQELNNLLLPADLVHSKAHTPSQHSPMCKCCRNHCQIDMLVCRLLSWTALLDGCYMCLQTHCKEGLDCHFGAEDRRDGRAVFFGSQTGWVTGRRHARLLHLTVTMTFSPSCILVMQQQRSSVLLQ